ncbi:MAG: 2-oxo acid dehydrogenase subunit E2 [Elusimicrobia bacterium]|nr:2-oxo acid dehydrogenase subunit E2 [Elusimicrobiota bacterium]
MKEFKLPELGENVHSGTIVNVMVAAGKPVAQGQAVVEVETDKAAIEVPSTVAGMVKEVRVRAGDKVHPGQVIFTVEGAAAEEKDPTPSPQPQARPSPAQAPAAPVEDYKGSADAPAAPSVRRLARDLGVDLSKVRPTGEGGRITHEDLTAYVKGRLAAGPSAAAAAPAALAAPALPDFGKWGGVERRPLSSVRRATAENLARAWSQVVAVTQHDEADTTELERLRKERSKGDVKVTMTSFAVKAAAAALAKFPQFNASIDMGAGELILKKYVHVGVAVDTDRGLLVPVIRDADQKSLAEVSQELAELAAKARAKKLSLDEMRGGTFTVTNLGGIGGSGFSPIVNWPEVAILGISRGASAPVWNGKSFEPRLLTPFSLSYDHRVIDGADGARFLRYVCELLGRPGEIR